MDMCRDESLNVFFSWSFIESYWSSGNIAFISCTRSFERFTDFNSLLAGMSSDTSVPYDLILYNLFPNSLRNYCIDKSDGRVNVPKASNAWHFVC